VNEARILLQAVFVTPEIDRPTDARRGQKAKLTGTPSGAATRSSAGHAAAAVCPAAFGRSQLGTHRDAGRNWPQLGEYVTLLSIGYMISRGLAKSGTKYAGGEDPLNRNNH